MKDEVRRVDSVPTYSELKRIYEESFKNEIAEFKRKYEGSHKQDVIAELKRKYIQARKTYEIARSNHHQNSSILNKQSWDNAANKLDHAYILLEIAMGAETYKGVTSERRELEAFIDSMKRGGR